MISAKMWSVRPARFAVLALTAALGGCVQLQAPEKPIEINLNINIR